MIISVHLQQRFIQEYIHVFALDFYFVRQLLQAINENSLFN